MNDHFWPSLYPGIIVGALVGVSRGGFIATLAGAAGGTAGAAIMYFATAQLGLDDGIISLAALIVGATAGAFLCEFCSSWLAANLRQGQ
jgi:hypothetical protein